MLAQNRCRRRQPTAGTLTLGEGLGPSLGTRPWAPPRRLIIFNILLLFVLFFFFCKLVRPPLKALFLRRFAFFWSHFQKMRVLFFDTLIVGYQGGIKMFSSSDAPLFEVGPPPVFKAFYVFWVIFRSKKKSQNSLEKGGAVTLKRGTKNLAKTLICKAFCPFSKKSSKFLKKLKILQKKSKNRQFLPNALIDSVFFFKKWGRTI